MYFSSTLFLKVYFLLLFLKQQLWIDTIVLILINSQIPCHTDGVFSELFVFSMCGPVGVASV